jgi:flagellar assembly factor FliW
VLQFPCGIPAFEDETRFLLLEQPEYQPIVFLQSLSCRNLCFMALPARLIDPSYHLSIPGEDLRRLGLAEDHQPALGADSGPSEVLALALLTVGADGRLYANLGAPVVVNILTRNALQAVQCDGSYALCQPVLARHGEAICS